MSFEPTAMEAEVQVVASVIENPAFLVEAELDPDKFYGEPHQILVRTIHSIHRDGLVPGVVSLLDYLNRDGLVEKAGGANYLSRIRSLATDDVELFKTAVQLVDDAAICRKYYKMAQSIMEESAIADNPIDLADFITNNLREINRLASDESVLRWSDSFAFRSEEVEQRIREYESGEVSLLDYPWKSWNNIIEPLEKGSLTLIAGLSGLGKTLVASHLAEHWAQSGFKVAFTWNLVMR